MRLMIWVGEEGPTDLDLKDGDIWLVQPNSWIPGSMETKKWLVVEMEEYGGDQSELIQPEYAVGSPDPVIRRARKYYVPYWTKLTPEQLVIVRDKTQDFGILADGTFDIWDITRK